MTAIQMTESAPVREQHAQPGGARAFLRRFLRHRAAAFSLLFLLALVVVAIFAPQLAPRDPTEIEMFRQVNGSMKNPPFAPSAQNWFGTDQLGRDIFSRVLYAIRTSLLIGVLVRGGAMMLGTLPGLVAGYFPGRFASSLMRLTDVMLSFPPLLVAMAVTAALGPSLFTVGVALVLVGWPDVSRLVYGQTLSVRESEYILAAKAVGVPPHRILLKHILPNITGPIIVAFSMGIPGAIMYEAGLSFFGFGIRPPMPSLGSIISDGRGYMEIAPWYTIFPGLTLVAIVLAFNFLGEGLIDLLDPRSDRN
jgi:ABC-type dipeptide/oligopeptide/nickel transport system permease subunit